MNSEHIAKKEVHIMATVRLPNPGGDDNEWGNILNTFLDVSHNIDGTLQAAALRQAGAITAGTSITISGTPTSGQVLTATSSTAATWIDPSGGGSGTLASDADVSLSAPANNQVLTYNSTAGKWTNQAPASGVSLDATATDIQPLGTRAAGSTGKAADAGHVHAMPRIDQLTTPTASVALGSQKITGLANGSASSDAAAYGQIPIAGTGSGTYAAGNDSRITSAIQASTATTKGDLLAASAAGTVTRLGVGANTYVLTADNTQTTGMKWAAAGSGSSGGAPTAWFNVVTQYGADNSGATNSHTAIQSAITAAAAATSGSAVVYFPAGTYLTSAGWDLPANITLQGDGSVGGTVTNTRKGSIIQVASSFTGTYVFGLLDTGHATVDGATIRGLMVYGGVHTSTAVDAVHIVGPTMTILRDIRIIQMSGWGITAVTDMLASQIGPFGQDWDSIMVDSCVSGGISLLFAEDSLFRNCYVIGCNGPGWKITGCDNAHFTDCRAEWNNGHGFWITNTTFGGDTYDWTYTTGMCQFHNCSTDANNQDGVHIDATWALGQGAGTGPAIILITGLTNRRDGHANNGATGTYAGLAVIGTNLPVIVNGFAQMTGIDDGSGGNISPRYGIYVANLGITPVQITSGMAWGFTGAVQTSGTVTNFTQANIITSATGANYNYNA